MSITAQQNPRIGESASRNFAVDFTDELDSGELLTGTPTVAELTSTDLTITNVAVNTAALTLTVDGVQRTVAIGKGVQGHVSGQNAATGYRVKVTAQTDASPAQTLICVLTFEGVTDTA